MSDATVHPTAIPNQHPSPLDRAGEWLKRRERAGLAFGVGFQVVILVGLIVSRIMPLATGETVLLRVVPVDPRDMFRGDYVILSYEFTRVWPGQIPGLAAPAPGGPLQGQDRTVYVSLAREPDGRHWRAAGFSVERPQSGVFLRGTLNRWGMLEFGIESYYVQQGTGREYEEAIRSRRLSAEVAVAPDGKAALRALRIE
jgi:uncharacterized membrane-anchored protein